MELDVIKQQTTWNDASNSINVNFSKIKQALALLEGADAGLNEEELIKFLEENGYATDTYVAAQISSIIGGADSDHDNLLKIQQILQGNEIDLEILKEKVDNIETDNGMFSWLDEEHTAIMAESSLIVKGDISDEGTGEAIVGVTSILVNGEYYPDLGGDGVIDLSNAFNNIDVDLDNYYTKEEVDDKFDNIDIGDVDLSNYYTKDETYSREEIDGLILESFDMFSWLDEEHTTIITDKNLIVEGDISDGGVGEAVVGVTGILIGEEVYYGEDGIVNLSAALGNIDVDLSDYYTIAEIDGLLTAYQPYETAINVDNIGAQSVAYADLSDKANKAYSLVNENDEEVIYIDGDSIFHVGDIIPEYNYNYYIGTDERYYKCVSSNAVFAGSTRNNLWLLAGSYDGMKIVFGSADSCATDYSDRTRFAELGDDGLQLNVDLILGDTTISEYDNVVTIEGSLIVEGDMASTDSSEGGSAIIPDLSDYATIDYVDGNFLSLAGGHVEDVLSAGEFYTAGDATVEGTLYADGNIDVKDITIDGIIELDSGSAIITGGVTADEFTVSGIVVCDIATIASLECTDELYASYVEIDTLSFGSSYIYIDYNGTGMLTIDCQSLNVIGDIHGHTIEDIYDRLNVIEERLGI